MCLWQFFMLRLISIVISQPDLIDNVHVNPETQAFHDSYNRERFFHGTNVVFKTFPWYPDGKNGNTFDESDMNNLRSVGMNVVRLGINWAGVMPVYGQINSSYIEEIGKIVGKLEKFGISVILDSHQDVLSDQFCGNGFPRMKDEKLFPFPFDLPYRIVNGTPSRENCLKHYWATYYLSYAVSSAFDDLYTNKNNLTTFYKQFWVAVALYFKDSKSVLGYNIINEPFPGNFYKNPNKLLPEVANAKILKFQDEIARGIRTVDDDKIVFFEGVTYAFSGTGFDYVPGGDEYANRSCISYHYYRPPNLSPLLTVMINDQAAKHLKTGRMLTEFFAHSRYKNSRKDVLNVIKVANSRLHSWISWQYKCFFQPNQNSDECNTFNDDRNNTFDVNIQDTFQIYPMVVAGNTHWFSYNPNSHQFHMKYEVSAGVKNSTTIIFAGFFAHNLKSDSGCPLSMKISGDYVYVDHMQCIIGSKIIITNFV